MEQLHQVAESRSSKMCNESEKILIFHAGQILNYSTKKKDIQ
jgi:hypothetical protein